MPQQIYHWVACVTYVCHPHSKGGVIGTLRSHLPNRSHALHPLLWKISVLTRGWLARQGWYTQREGLLHTNTSACLSSLVKLALVEFYCP